ncbi:MAG: DUF1998 domain-containing protein, partial [Bacteroidetes bacterium]|nr:DUF1998 domain-containing protein [Bacteroidota bacterium]
HHYLYGFRSIEPKRDSEIKRYDRTSKLVPTFDPELKRIGGILGIAYHPECKLSFRNNGVTRNEGQVEYLEKRTGCDLKREGIVFSMPSEIAISSSIFISLLSALDRAIKDRYGLDENDLKLLLDIQILPFEENETKALLYDSSGNGAIPFKKVVDEFDSELGALRRAYDRLNNCPNKNCDQGCYLCLRSYGTQYYASELNKSSALMAVGYLLGRNPFIPEIEHLNQSSGEGLYLNLFLEKEGTDGIVVHAGESTCSQKLTNQQNIDIYSIISKAIAVNTQSDQRFLRIIIPHEWPYLNDILTGKRLGKDARADEKLKFEELLFQLLRFDKLEVIPYEKLFRELN